MKSVKNDLALLNKILGHKVSVEMERESVVSIRVDYNKSRLLVKELSNNLNISYSEYLKSNLESNGLDICDLWTLLEDTHDVEIWFNRKQVQFYIPNWYQKIIIVYKLKKREIKFLIKDLKRNLKMVLEV
jgi:hypothetical protein